MQTDNITQLLNHHLGPVLGHYSFEKHIAISFIVLSVLLVLITTIVKLRGQGIALARECFRDVILGTLFALTIIGFPAGFYFIGRAIFRSAASYSVSAP